MRLTWDVPIIEDTDVLVIGGSAEWGADDAGGEVWLSRRHVNGGHGRSVYDLLLR